MITTEITILIMDLMEKYDWLPANVANYLIKNNIDVETIPEMVSK